MFYLRLSSYLQTIIGREKLMSILVEGKMPKQDPIQKGLLAVMALCVLLILVCAAVLLFSN